MRCSRSGAFADLVSPDFTGHSRAVGELAGSAAAIAGCSAAASAAVRRAGYLHDLGRIGVPFAVWQRPGKVDADGWEKIRLHPYYTERVLGRSPFLAALGSVAGCHHERLDGSGYHRGLPAAGLGMPARLLAAADAYRTKTEPRPHRAALAPGEAAAHLRSEAAAGRLDPDGVAVVLEAAGHRPGVVGPARGAHRSRGPDPGPAGQGEGDQADRASSSASLPRQPTTTSSGCTARSASRRAPRPPSTPCSTAS